MKTSTDIGLFHPGGKRANLALMKIAGMYKLTSATVKLNAIGSEANYISCVFEHHAGKALELAANCDNPYLGGYGVNDAKLPNEIEHAMPDYDLFEVDCSAGYTTRGCVRSCDWCVVPKHEGPIRHNAYIAEFYDSRFDKLLLYDNSFFAGPYWREHVATIVELDLQVSFWQGLDIRLVDEEVATALISMKVKNSTFKSSTLTFAFDRLEDESQVKAGITELQKVGIKPYRLVFYLLTNFNTTHAEDMQRFEFLKRLKCYPYVMVYDKPNAPPIARHFARWVNAYVYRVCDFDDYQPYLRSLQ